MLAGVQHGRAVGRDGELGRTDEGLKCNHTAAAGIRLLTVLRLILSRWTVANVSLIFSVVSRIFNQLIFYLRGEFHRIFQHSSFTRNLCELPSGLLVGVDAIPNGFLSQSEHWCVKLGICRCALCLKSEVWLTSMPIATIFRSVETICLNRPPTYLGAPTFPQYFAGHP